MQDTESETPSELGVNTQQTSPAKRGLSLMARAIRYLSLRDHSEVELRQKLAKFAETPAQLDETLNKLRERGWTDNTRFANAFVQRQSSRHGINRIKQGLRQHQLGADVESEALAGLKESEVARCQAVWERKFGQAPTDAPSYAKQARFLQYRGFGADVVQRVLKAAQRADAQH